ncbi:MULTISPECIES: anhydro-N-acetylmuramic acid kinase [Legionella]|uniref:Anhydro-N-acetylmuramic acid kinase n=1 Tax=Legionella resiliens TaxID=2905958 RepID=A0ABS8X2V9_9GAMM|nr:MULTISPECIES: anhydro-N-acetylmuramic acid kinase [unclassified Legionella]MCE0723928.1 anhydro-N-acetylmuramic acid kinase [Legionella sp. 9fVS26]MCE3533080.1 anhydro-N-acetylmuramic acid kinase [Legionella sp. 8cVS16]QLZ69273.1 anhydro-N-acetylmuramic acid kinase [Legionella sp. PC1000]
MTLYIGLMSGTSMDGIDAALVDVSTNTLLYGITKKYSNEVVMRMEKLLSGSDLSVASICQLNTLIGREFAYAVNELLQKAKLSASDICSIGSHGQTVCHNTQCTIPYTLQLGCAHTIAALTGITVVADFRTRDLVLGGQGAPFAPLYHYKLFGNENNHVAVVNIGGIANITLINANEPIKGWDVGPGNCLMDAWIMKHQGKSYDANGVWARQGKVIEPLLEMLMSDSFVNSPSPKSIGKEYFSLLWLEGHLKEQYQPADVQKTLLAFTAKTIADTVLNEQNHAETMYLCGGGTHNSALLHMLIELLPQTKVKSIAEIGLSPDYLEAMMFAWLAEQTINQIPVDLCTITGARQPAILGAIYPVIK